MNPPSHQAHSDKQPLLGDLLVMTKLITAEQLQEVLTYQAGLKKYRPLGLILVDKKLITAWQLNHFLDIYRKRAKIGEILVNSKAITTKDLNIALQFKKTIGKRLGQVLLQLGHVKEDVLQQGLALQRNIPFVELDRTTLAPNLAGFIHTSYAQKNLVVPIQSSPADLTIAVEDPTNYILITELQAMIKLKVLIVTSTKGQIARAIQRVYVTNKLTGELVVEEGFQFEEAGKAF